MYRSVVFACSFCISVAPPAWWSSPVPAPMVGLALLGLVIGFLALDRAKGLRRVGGFLVAIGLTVALPLAALSVNAGRMSVEVATANPPMDARAWNVTCATAFQAAGDDVYTAACSDATARWRWTATALASVSAALVIAGVATAARRGRSMDDERAHLLAN